MLSSDHPCEKIDELLLIPGSKCFLIFFLFHGAFPLLLELKAACHQT